jgi:hypothetical protein
MNCFKPFMQLIPPASPLFALLESQSHQPKPTPRPIDRPSSQNPVHEVETYIQIRDNFVAEAERTLTPKALERATLANEFVATCVKPARGPYQAQYLPEPVAMRERQRCEAITNRLALLSRLVAARSEQAHAA